MSEESVTKNKNRKVAMPEGNNYLDRLLKNKLKRNDGLKTTEESYDFRRKSTSKFKANSQIASKRSKQQSEVNSKESSELRNVIRNARFDAMSKQSKNNQFSPLPVTLNQEPTNIQLFNSSDD